METLLNQLCHWQHPISAPGFHDDPAARAQLYNQIIQKLNDHGMCISMPVDIDVPRLVKQLCRDVGLGAPLVGCPAAKIIGAILREGAAVAKITIEQQAQVLSVLCQVVSPIVTKEQVKVALWGLSCQCLSPVAVLCHLESLLSLIRQTLPLNNAWASVMITLHAVHLVSRLLLQVPQQVLERCMDWLPLIWPLLLACPPPHLHQDANRHKVYMELRTQARNCMQTAQQLLCNSPSGSQLEVLLAQQMMATGGLLEQMKVMVDAAQVGRSSGKGRPGSPATSTPPLPPYAVPVAESAVHACSLYIQLLGGSLTRDIRRLGQPVLDLLKSAFTHTSSVQLPRASFQAWNHLANAFAAAGTLSKRRKLLLQPIDYTLTHDKRKEVKMAALDSWLHLVKACGQHGVQHTLVVDTELFLGLVAPVVEVVTGCKPGAATVFADAIPQVVELLKTICSLELLPVMCDLALRVLQSSRNPTPSYSAAATAVHLTDLWSCIISHALSHLAASLGGVSNDQPRQQSNKRSDKLGALTQFVPSLDKNDRTALMDLHRPGWDGGGGPCHLCNSVGLKEQWVVLNKVQEVWKALVDLTAGFVPAARGTNTAGVVEDAVRSLVTAHGRVLQQVCGMVEVDKHKMTVIVKQQNRLQDVGVKMAGVRGDVAGLTDQHAGACVTGAVCNDCLGTAAAQMLQYCKEELQVLLSVLSMGEDAGLVGEGERTPRSNAGGGRHTRSWVWRAASRKTGSNTIDLDQPGDGNQLRAGSDMLPLVGRLLHLWLDAAVQLHWTPWNIVAPAASAVLEEAGDVLALHEFLQLVYYCLSPTGSLTPLAPAAHGPQGQWDSIWLKVWVLLCSPLTNLLEVCKQWRFPPEAWPDMLTAVLDILDLPLHGPARADKQANQHQALHASRSIDLNQPILPQESVPAPPSSTTSVPAAGPTGENTSQQLHLLSQVSSCWVQLFETVSACWVLWPQQAQQHLYTWATKLQTMLESESRALERDGGAFLLLTAASSCSVARFLSDHPLTASGQGSKIVGMARRSLTPGRGATSPFSPTAASCLTPGATPLTCSSARFTPPPSTMTLLCGLMNAAVNLDCKLLAWPNNITQECRENAFTVLGIVLQCMVHLFCKAGNAQDASEQLQYLDPSLKGVFKHLHSLSCELQNNSIPCNAPATILASWQSILEHVRKLIDLNERVDGCLICLQDALRTALDPTWPALFTCTFQLLDSMVSRAPQLLQLPAQVEQALAEAGAPETQMQDMQNNHRMAFRAADSAQRTAANKNTGLHLNSQDMAIIYGRAPPLKQRELVASQTNYVRIPPMPPQHPIAGNSPNTLADGPPPKRQRTLSTSASAMDCSTVVQPGSPDAAITPAAATEAVDAHYVSLHSGPGSIGTQGASGVAHAAAVTTCSAPVNNTPGVGQGAADQSSGLGLQSKVIHAAAPCPTRVRDVMEASPTNGQVKHTNGSGDPHPSRGVGQSAGTGTGTSDGAGQEATSPPFPSVSTAPAVAPIPVFTDTKPAGTFPGQPATTLSIPPFSPLSSILPLSSVPLGSLPLSSVPLGSLPPLLSMNPSGLFSLPSGLTALDTLPPLDSTLPPLDSHILSPPNALSNLDSLFGPAGPMHPPATPVGAVAHADAHNSRQAEAVVGGAQGEQGIRSPTQLETSPQSGNKPAFGTAAHISGMGATASQGLGQYQEPPHSMGTAARAEQGADLGCKAQNILTPSKASAGMRSTLILPTSRNDLKQTRPSQSPNACVHSEGQDESECSLPASGQLPHRMSASAHLTPTAGRAASASKLVTAKGGYTPSVSMGLDGEVRSTAQMDPAAQAQDFEVAVSREAGAGAGISLENSHALDPCFVSSQQQLSSRPNPSTIVLPAALLDLPSVTRPVDNGVSTAAATHAPDALKHTPALADLGHTAASLHDMHTGSQGIAAQPAAPQQIQPPTTHTAQQAQGTLNHIAHQVPSTVSGPADRNAANKRSHVRSESYDDGSICSSMPSHTEPGIPAAQLNQALLAAASQAPGRDYAHEPTTSQHTRGHINTPGNPAMTSPFQAQPGLQPVFATQSNLTGGAAAGDRNMAGEVVGNAGVPCPVRSAPSQVLHALEPVPSRQITTEQAVGGDTTCVTSGTQPTPRDRDMMVLPSGLSLEELSQLQEALDKHTSGAVDAGPGHTGEPSVGKGTAGKGSLGVSRVGSGSRAVTSAARQGTGASETIVVVPEGDYSGSQQPHASCLRTSPSDTRPSTGVDAISQAASRLPSGSASDMQHPASSTGLVGEVKAMQMGGGSESAAAGSAGDDADVLEIHPTQDVLAGMPLAVQRMLSRTGSVAQVRSSSLPTSAAMEAVKLMQHCHPTTPPACPQGMLNSELHAGIGPQTVPQSHTATVDGVAGVAAAQQLQSCTMATPVHGAETGGDGSNALGSGTTRVGSGTTQVGSDVGAPHELMDALFTGAQPQFSAPAGMHQPPWAAQTCSPPGGAASTGHVHGDLSNDLGILEGAQPYGVSHTGAKQAGPAPQYPTRMTSNVMLLRKPPAGVSGLRSPSAQLPPAFSVPPSSLQPAINALVRAPSVSGGLGANRKIDQIDVEHGAAPVQPLNPAIVSHTYADLDNAKYAHRTIAKAGTNDAVGTTRGGAGVNKPSAAIQNKVPTRLDKGPNAVPESKPNQLERAVSFQLPSGPNRFVPSGLRLLFPNKSIESNESCTAPRPKHGANTEPIPTWANTFGDNPATAEAVAAAAAAAAAAEPNFEKGCQNGVGRMGSPPSGALLQAAKVSSDGDGLRRGSSGLGPGSVMGPPADVVVLDQAVEPPAADSALEAAAGGDRGKSPHPLLQQLKDVLAKLQDEQLEAQDVWMGHSLSLSLANLFANRMFGARSPGHPPSNA